MSSLYELTNEMKEQTYRVCTENNDTMQAVR